jgi:hypothetical protein
MGPQWDPWRWVLPVSLFVSKHGASQYVGTRYERAFFLRRYLPLVSLLETMLHPPPTQKQNQTIKIGINTFKIDAERQNDDSCNASRVALNI